MKTQKSIFLRSFRFIGLIGIIIASLNSCKKSPLPTPTPTGFRNLSINGACNVTLLSGSSNKVNSSDFTVQLTTMGNTLMVNGAGKATITVNDLDTLISNGLSIIDGTSVTLTKDIVVACNGADSLTLSVNATDSITVLINGTGRYHVSGTTPKLNVTGNGTGKFYGYNLISKNCDVFMNGSTDKQVYATGILNVWMNGTGNLYYKGNPSIVNKFNNGTGQLIKQ